MNGREYGQPGTCVIFLTIENTVCRRPASYEAMTMCDNGHSILVHLCQRCLPLFERQCTVGWQCGECLATTKPAMIFDLVLV